MIACIVCLSIGVMLAVCAIFHLVKMICNRDEEYRVIPIMFCGVLSAICITSSLIHWHDDDEYKIIECAEYRVEKIVTYSNETQSTTYKIYFKSK